jgi:two-component system chemotaxis response regulator CheB
MTPFQIVTIGTSLGGFEALRVLLGGLPKDFPLPVAVVQHRSYEDCEAFAPLLAGHTQLPVIEVEDKQEIREGQIYLGPPNYHLLVERSHFALSADEPVMHARPAIDVFFETAADAFGAGVVGVLLTGMSRDGSAGLRKIKARGGFAVVQDPKTAEGAWMPQAAISSVLVDQVLRLEDIASLLVELCVTGSKP